ncbi:MAG: hypothetical protein KF785_15160 [Gemmatimonadales bacterium]|nr:hypothetical protein [Gemmatimonadales bacterium]
MIDATRVTPRAVAWIATLWSWSWLLRSAAGVAQNAFGSRVVEISR